VEQIADQVDQQSSWTIYYYEC